MADRIRQDMFWVRSVPSPNILVEQKNKGYNTRQRQAGNGLVNVEVSR